MFLENRRFLGSLSVYSYERCGVASVDMAYPLNRDLFGQLVSETPAVIFKDPNTFGNLFVDLGWEKTQNSTLSFNNITHWGSIAVKDQIGKISINSDRVSFCSAASMETRRLKHFIENFHLNFT